jgi:hypothetical protein
MSIDMKEPTPSASDAHDDLDDAELANEVAEETGEPHPFGDPAMVILEKQSEAAELDESP